MFSAFAARFGHKINLSNPEGISKSFNEMLAAVQGQPEQHVLESLGIRTMAKAIYTTENIGHYGLGFDDYCHFTSPIRRYPDVLVHRILDQCLRKDIRPIKNLEQLCRHCSAQERSAMDAERAGNKYKSVEFMQQYVGEEFEAVISGVSGFGFWAETVDHKCEGLVTIQSLRELDFFDLLEAEYALVGENTGLRFRIGDRVKIRVDAANLDKRQLDYSLVEGGVVGKAGGARRMPESAGRKGRDDRSSRPGRPAADKSSRSRDDRPRGARSSGSARSGDDKKTGGKGPSDRRSKR
jgi:ribonuclease R